MIFCLRSRVDILTPLPEEVEPSRDEDISRTAAPVPHPATTTYQDIPGGVPSGSSQPLRTLLHPYEAAQQVRMMGPQRTEEDTTTSESDGSVVNMIIFIPSGRQPQPRLFSLCRLNARWHFIPLSVPTWSRAQQAPTIRPLYTINICSAIVTQQLR